MPERDLRDEIFEYAGGLYAKAIREMEAERFARAEVFAICSYSAAMFLASDGGAPEEFRADASRLQDAAWTVSRQAHSSQRWEMLKPSMGDAEDDLEDVREEVAKLAKLSMS